MQAPLPYAVDNRLPEILEQLRQLSPPRQKAAATNSLDQLIYGVLAQGLSSAGATASFRRLRETFPKFSDLRDAKPEALRQLLIGVPAAALKASAIPEILRQVEDAFGSLTLDPLNSLDTERALRFLTRLPRVTEEVAVAVLRLCGAERTVMTVDQDIARPLRRIGLVEKGAPLSALPRQLIERSPTEWRSSDFYDLSRGMARVADRWCHKGKTDCRSCPLQALCRHPSANEQTGEVVSFPFGRKKAV